MNDFDFTMVQQRIHEGLLEHAIPGMAVAVAHEGRIVWEAGFGWADREKRRAASEHTVFPIASVTKSMTATGIMRLVELGKLDLDKPINHYLPRDTQLKVWVGDPEELTVRRVANHTGGLTHFSNSYHASDRAPEPSQAEVIRRYAMAVVEPGERYRYSNIGYGVLDYLISQVSGMSFADFLHQEVFVPLGMCRSATGLPARLEPFAATRYDEQAQPTEPGLTSHAGASDGWASAHDLLRFGLFHLKQPLTDQKRILSDDALDAMHEPPVKRVGTPGTDPNVQPVSCYGVGFVIDPELTPRRISHAGGMDGCASKLLMLPDEQIVIAIVSNRFKSLAYELEHDILEATLSGYQRPTAPDAPAHKPEADAGALAPLRGAWSGHIHTHEGPMDITLEFLACGHVYVQVGALQQKALLNKVRFEDDWLTGTFGGMIETADANRKGRYPIHHLQLDVKLRGDRLAGAVVCVSGVQLGHWVELTRDAGAASDKSG